MYYEILGFYYFNNLIHINFEYCQYQINQIGDFKVPDKNFGIYI